MRFTSANAAPQNCYDDSCRIIRRYEVQTSIENRFSKGACVQDGKGRLRRTKHSAALEFVDRRNRNRNSKGTLGRLRSEEHTSELQSRFDLVCRLLLEKK